MLLWGAGANRDILSSPAGQAPHLISSLVLFGSNSQGLAGNRILFDQAVPCIDEQAGVLRHALGLPQELGTDPAADFASLFDCRRKNLAWLCRDTAEPHRHRSNERFHSTPPEHGSSNQVAIEDNHSSGVRSRLIAAAFLRAASATRQCRAPHCQDSEGEHPRGQQYTPKCLGVLRFGTWGKSVKCFAQFWVKGGSSAAGGRASERGFSP